MDLIVFYLLETIGLKLKLIRDLLALPKNATLKKSLLKIKMRKTLFKKTLKLSTLGSKLFSSHKNLPKHSQAPNRKWSRMTHENYLEKFVNVLTFTMSLICQLPFFHFVRQRTSLNTKLFPMILYKVTFFVCNEKQKQKMTRLIITGWLNNLTDI